MNPADAKAAILALLRKTPQLFVLSTVDEDGAPQSRLMGAVMVKDGTLVYMASDSDARKVRQIQDNPKVQVLCWSADLNEVATVSGTATMETSPQVRRAFWDAVPSCAKHYSSPDDPALGIIRISLTRGEYLNRPAGYEIISVAF